jgi:predicted DNA-binding transcriptional regulator YafY
MEKSKARGEQLSRLFRMILELQGGRTRSARDLAEICGVSRRTLYRDLRTLEAAGVPIVYQPDRMGYRLSPTFSFFPPDLDEKEALALVLLVRQSTVEDSFGLHREASSGVAKVVNALPPAVRLRIGALSEAILGRGDGSPGPEADSPAATAILDALARRRQVRIWYEADGGAEESTKLSPYRLVRSGESWEVVGRSTLHRGVRSFRLPAIREAVVTEDTYATPPRFAAGRHLGSASRLDPNG